MDSNKNTRNDTPNLSGGSFSDTGRPNNGNRNNYNRKKKTQHFGPSQSPNSPANADMSANETTSKPNMSNMPNAPRRNNGQQSTGAQGGGGNLPPRPKAPGQQPPSNPQRNQNAPYSATTNPRPQGPQSNTSNNGNRNIPRPMGQQPNIQPQPQQATRPNRKWEDRMVKIEETYEDIKKENERIEKEIWLEIAEIHNAKLD